MPRSITLLTPKEIDLEILRIFGLASKYRTSSQNNCLIVEKEHNPENVSRSYLMVDISDMYLDVAINDYLEFDNLNGSRRAFIKNCSFVNIQHNDPAFLNSYLNDFFLYFHSYSNQILIDDDFGNLYTIEEFKRNYFNTSAG